MYLEEISYWVSFHSERIEPKEVYGINQFLHIIEFLFSLTEFLSFFCPLLLNIITLCS
jgi:hypothetical protein